MVFVLRLNHRIFRDKRISTHCALVARAFGAEKIFYSGERDKKLEESIRKTANKWGDGFGIEYVRNWKSFVEGFPGKKIHLTMYGIPLPEKIREIRKEKNILVIVGGEKVPSEVYKLSDWNVSITLQPHSEVAALAVFLHEYFQGKEFRKKFKNAKVSVVPQERGKKVLDLGE